MSESTPTSRPPDKVQGTATPVIIAGSAQMLEVLAIARRSAAGDAKVLVTGESGVGKDLIARADPRHARNATSGPFVAVNCAGLTETLLESELFGHVKGSFTGAYRDKPGKLQLADGGTLFLDEVGEMSLRMQALLLRFLETGEIQSVGAARSARDLNVRVIAATNRNLAERSRPGEFREDLLYRLRVIHIHVPPLRERRDDIPPLVEHFLKRSERRGARSPTRRCSRCSATGGRATSASCRTSSSRRVALPTGNIIDVGHLPRRAAAAVDAAADRASAAGRSPTSCTRRWCGRLFLLGPRPPALPERDLTRHDIRELVCRGLAHDPRQLPGAAAAVRHLAPRLQAIPQFPDGARVQGGLPLVPPGHPRARAPPAAAAAAAQIDPCGQGRAQAEADAGEYLARLCSHARSPRSLRR